MKARQGFRIFRVGLAVSVFLVASHSVFAQNTVRREIPVGHIPLKLIKPAVEGALSPQGRFVNLPANGTVLVIDVPENIPKVQAAIANIKAPKPNVALDFAFKTGIAGGLSKARPVELGSFPFPRNFQPTRIIPAGPNNFIVIPAHPTNFTRRNVGTTLETNPTVNPDGSISLDINATHTEFEGFINYGSAILASGGVGTVPVAQIGNPQFFRPFLNTGKILVPVFSTTRITTQVLVKPSVGPGKIRVDMIPQLKVEAAEEGAEDQVVTLQKFRTQVDVKNNGISKLSGFKGASGAFNRNFMGGNDEQEGTSALVIKARIFHGEFEEKKPGEEPKESEAKTPEEPAPAASASRDGTN
ncbi:MAG: hypothetical protein HKN23_09770 [Verrucomicrobiales bacterium]|nr:hypothetical protein [Verrucomicrobiales bacterium]